jgi:hypothetical protein
MSDPPLLMLAQGRKPRPREAPASRPKEITLHMAAAKVLRDHCLSDWQWTHVGAGELRDIRTAGKLKATGVRRGWPDFVLVPPIGRLHCLELKRQGEELSEDQENFQIWCVRHGTPYVVARNLDQVLVAFDVWGCLRIQIGGAP